MANKVVVDKMRTAGLSGKVKAYFSIRIGPLEIDDLKLIDGSNGTFIGFPSRKIVKDGEADKWIDVVRLVRGSDKKYTAGAQELYDAIQEAALAEFAHRGGEAIKSKVEDDDVDSLPF